MSERAGIKTIVRRVYTQCIARPAVLSNERVGMQPAARHACAHHGLAGHDGSWSSHQAAALRALTDTARAATSSRAQSVRILTACRYE